MTVVDFVPPPATRLDRIDALRYERLIVGGISAGRGPLAARPPRRAFAASAGDAAPRSRPGFGGLPSWPVRLGRGSAPQSGRRGSRQRPERPGRGRAGPRVASAWDGAGLTARAGPAAEAVPPGRPVPARRPI